MKLTDYLTLARRYKIDRQPQSAWPLDLIDNVIETIVNEGSAIVEMALAYSTKEKISEEFPLIANSQIAIANTTTFTLINEYIPRDLGEEWSTFIQRTAVEAKEIKADLLTRFNHHPNLNLPDNYQLFCRISWAGEVEWQERLGQNLIKLFEGDIDHPEIGEDMNGITYRFQYPGHYSETKRLDNGSTLYLSRSDSPDGKKGRNIFYKAEDICVNLEFIKPHLFEFLTLERKKILPEESIIPEIVSFKLEYADDWENIRIFAFLNDANQENDPLYQYWKVEILDFHTFRMIG